MRFDARFVHTSPGIDGSTSANIPPAPVIANPDEILIEDEGTEVNIPITAGNETDSSAFAHPTDGARESSVPDVALNPDEIVLEDEVEAVLPPVKTVETKFIALDKCLPRRQFLEVGLFFDMNC